MRFVELSGTARERGQQHGEALRELIRGASFDQLLGSRLQGKPEVEQEIRELEDTLDREYPQALQEIRGIAEGANLTYPEVFRLNFYYALGLQQQACTYVGLVGEDGTVILGKNEDASPRDLLTMFRCTLPDASVTLMATYAGTISNSCGNGVNSRGLAIVGASIGPVKAYRRLDRIPFYLLCTRMLERLATVGECMSELRGARFSGAANFAFADRAGAMVGVEAASDAAEMFHYSKDGAIYRANHPLLPEIAARLDPRPEYEAGLVNSRKRMETLEMLLAETPFTLEGMKGIFRSHHPHTYICEHFQVNGAVMNSDGSFIVLPSEGRMLGLVGFPCEQEYQEFSC